jgi:hypothetical protein
VYSPNDCICLWVVTCSWFDFNVLIVTHLLELTFEFAPIVKDNRLKSHVTCQIGVMKNSWMDVADLFVALTISNQPVLIAGSIIVIGIREYVLPGVLIING